MDVGDCSRATSAYPLLSSRGLVRGGFEVDLDIQFDQDGLSVLGGWGEFILLDCLYGFVVIGIVKSTKYADVLWFTLLVDPEVDKYVGIDSRCSLLFRELRFYLVDDSGRQYAAADSPGDRGHVFWVLGLYLWLAGGGEEVFEGDGRVDFGRDSIGEDGFVSPSLHGVDGAFAKYVVSAFDGEDLDDSFGGDAGVEDHCAFAVGGFCFVGVDGVDDREEISGHYGRGDVRWGGRRVWLGCGRDAEAERGCDGCK
jgi:hypothetical protein